MVDDPYKVAFGLILAAGNSRAKAHEAIEAARQYRFDDARALLRAAEEEFKAAHDLQFGMLQMEAKKQHVDVNIILVHAQDHLTMALMARENAEELTHIYSAIADLKHTISTIKENEHVH